MSMYLYDQALVDQLRSITGDDRVHVIPPDEAISFLAQINNDKAIFPAVLVSRGNMKIFPETKNQVSILKGQTTKLTPDNTAVKLKELPMNISWQIDVFTTDRYSCDEIIREIVFYLITYPRFQVKVPYGLDVPQNFDVLVEPEIVDNSDLLEFVNRGDLFRETITVYTENAHLFSSGKLYLTKVSPDVETLDKGK